MMTILNRDIDETRQILKLDNYISRPSRIPRIWIECNNKPFVQQWVAINCLPRSTVNWQFDTNWDGQEEEGCPHCQSLQAQPIHMMSCETEHVPIFKAADVSDWSDLR